MKEECRIYEHVNLRPREDLSFGVCLVDKRFRSVELHDSAAVLHRYSRLLSDPRYFISRTRRAFGQIRVSYRALVIVAASR